MQLYTIGFTKKSAERFFNLLIQNNVRVLIDVRLNNKSQLAGFAKADDLRYFLQTIAGIKYIHLPFLAPTKELLNDYKQGKIRWEQYVPEYLQLLKQNDILSNLDITDFEDGCLLCSEDLPEQCHRRLLAEHLQSQFPKIDIIHL